MRAFGLIVLLIAAAPGCGECPAPSVSDGVTGHGYDFIAEGEGSREPLPGGLVRAFEGGLDGDGLPQGELVLRSELTDECGLFQLALAPGDYSMCAEACDADPCVEVTVGTGTVEYDFTVDLGNCTWRQVR